MLIKKSLTDNNKYNRHHEIFSLGSTANHIYLRIYMLLLLFRLPYTHAYIVEHPGTYLNILINTLLNIFKIAHKQIHVGMQLFKSKPTYIY